MKKVPAIAAVFRSASAVFSAAQMGF